MESIYTILEILAGIGIVGLVVVFHKYVLAIVAIVAVAIAARVIYKKTRPPKVLEAAKNYAYLEEDVSREKIATVVEPYKEDAVLAPYAQGVLDSFVNAELRRKGIFSIMEQEFDRSSLTWEKFSAPVETALDSIRHNNLQIANYMQAFDSKEYQRMGRLRDAGAYKEDSTEIKRLATMAETLDKMDEIQKGNEQLLMELERLQAELTRMSGAGYDAETEEIAAEISKLAEETKYYAR